MSSSPKYALVMATSAPIDVVPPEFLEQQIKEQSVPSFYPVGYTEPEEVQTTPNRDYVQEMVDKQRSGSVAIDLATPAPAPAPVMVEIDELPTSEIEHQRKIVRSKRLITFIAILQMFVGIMTIFVNFNFIGIIYGGSHIVTSVLGTTAASRRAKPVNALRYHIANSGQAAFTGFVYILSIIVAITSSMPFGETFVGTFGILLLFMIQSVVCRCSRNHFRLLRDE